MTSEKGAQEFHTDDSSLPRELDSAMSLKGQGNAPVNCSCAHAPPLRAVEFFWSWVLNSLGLGPLNWQMLLPY